MEEDNAKTAHMLDSALLVTTFKAVTNIETNRYGTYRPDRSVAWWFFIFFLILQFAIAAIPVIRGFPSSTGASNWGIFIITGFGNVLAILTASPSSAREEKYQGREHSKETYAITRGNGHKHVFILLPDTLRRNMSRLDANGKAWMDQTPTSSLPHLEDLANAVHRAGWIARGASVLLALCWIVLLLAIGGLQDGGWFLLGVGLLGMIHNTILAGGRRNPAAHGIPLQQLDEDENEKTAVEDLDEQKGYLQNLTPNPLEGDTTKLGELGRKRDPEDNRPGVMDVLYALERKFPGAGHSLRPVFFPGRLRKYEEMKWNEEAYSLETITRRSKQRRHRWYTERQLIPDKYVRPFVDMRSREAPLGNVHSPASRLENTNSGGDLVQPVVAPSTPGQGVSPENDINSPTGSSLESDLYWGDPATPVVRLPPGNKVEYTYYK